MANDTTTTMQTTYTQESDDADDDWENIPPEVEAQVRDMVGCSSTQPSGENQPPSRSYDFSTPAPASSRGGGKAKSRLSGLQSALTPILKYLNISNKCQSPGSLKQDQANNQNESKASIRHPNLDISSSHPGGSLVCTNAPVRFLEDEHLPEITLLDVTCDSTMQVTKNDSALHNIVPATPVTNHSVCSSVSTHPPPKLNASTSQMSHLKMDDLPENAFAPLRWLDDRYFPEITLLDVTRDSELSPAGERSTMNVTQDISPTDASKTNVASSVLSEQTAAKNASMEIIRNEDLSSTLEGNATHTINSVRNLSNSTKASLESTRDISVGNVSASSCPSLAPSEQSMASIHTTEEDAHESHPVNVTRDMSSSSDTSVQSATTQSSTCGMQCDTSSKTVTSEAHTEVTANNEEPHISCDASSTVTAGSANDTFTVGLSANLSSSSSLSSSAQTPQNKTLEHPPSNVTENDAKDSATPLTKNTTEDSLVVNPSAVKTGGSCEVQNATFDRNSLRQSSGNSTLGEAAAGTFCLQNNTFDTKPVPQQNGTITLSETSSNDTHQNTLDKPPPSSSFSSKVCNATCSPKNTASEAPPSESSKHNTSTASTDPNCKTTAALESTFEGEPPVEKASEASKSENKDSSQTGLPMKDSLYDTSANQSRDLESNRANTFSLDDTLDLAAAALITSTPMPSCKVFNFNNDKEVGNIFGATKKLYGGDPSQADNICSNIVCDKKTFLTKPAAESLLPSTKSASHLLKYKPASTIPGKFGDGPSKSDCQVMSDVPISNIVSDRKTFLSRPTANSLLPQVKAASHLLKYKPSTVPPGKVEPMMTGLPMTRQRAQAETQRSTAASDEPPVPAGTSNSYNLRPTTIGSKQLNSGLRKPQSSGIPSGIQRAAAGLRQPLTRSNGPAPVPSSSATDKLRLPTATNHASKILQGKKHPLSRAEALQVAAKRRKMDPPLSSCNAEVSTSSCDATNRVKNLKQPTNSQRALPAKTQREGAAASTAENSTSGDAVSKARALKQPGAGHRPVLAKAQAHGCTNCVALEQQLKLKTEENRRLKEELQKYRKEVEEC